MFICHNSYNTRGQSPLEMNDNIGDKLLFRLKHGTEHVAHVCTKTYNLICLRHLLTSTEGSRLPERERGYFLGFVGGSFSNKRRRSLHPRKSKSFNNENSSTILMVTLDSLTLEFMGGFKTHNSKSSERGIRNKMFCKDKNFQLWAARGCHRLRG